MEINAWSTIWNFFDLTRPQQPPSERVPYIREKMNFWWSIPQKITSIGYFGASDDQTIRIRKCLGGNWALEAVEACEVAEAAEVNEAGEVSKAWKIITVTSESSRFLNSIILGLILLYFEVLKKILFWQNHENSCWILPPFLSRAVEATWGQKSFKWLIRHKIPLLRKPLSISFW
jgi:hypothetical protein